MGAALSDCYAASSPGVGATLSDCYAASSPRVGALVERERAAISLALRERWQSKTDGEGKPLTLGSEEGKPPTKLYKKRR